MSLHRVLLTRAPLLLSEADREYRRAIFSSTDRRVECLTTEFAGAEETIAFRVHTEGFEEGEEAKGFFQIVSNRGEYELPFLITVQRPALVGMAEEVENLTQFAALAHRDWLEAVRLFYLPEFEVILQENQEVLTLYQALSGVPGNQSNVEEFLIACGKKVQVDYLILNKELKIENPIGVAEYELQIFKNGWGYTLLTVHTEGNFLYVEKEQLTDDDFLGNRCILFVYVDDAAAPGEESGADHFKRRTERNYHSCNGQCLKQRWRDCKKGEAGKGRDFWQS